jgi:hypothetical protein
MWDVGLCFVRAIHIQQGHAIMVMTVKDARRCADAAESHAVTIADERFLRRRLIESNHQLTYLKIDSSS